MKQKIQNNEDRRTFLYDLSKTIFFAGISSSMIPLFNNCIESVSDVSTSSSSAVHSCTSGKVCKSNYCLSSGVICKSQSFKCEPFSNNCKKENDCETEYTCSKNSQFKCEMLNDCPKKFNCLYSPSCKITQHNCPKFECPVPFKHNGGEGS